MIARLGGRAGVERPAAVWGDSARYRRLSFPCAACEGFSSATREGNVWARENDSEKKRMLPTTGKLTLARNLPRFFLQVFGWSLRSLVFRYFIGMRRRWAYTEVAVSDHGNGSLRFASCAAARNPSQQPCASSQQSDEANKCVLSAT